MHTLIFKEATVELCQHVPNQTRTSIFPTKILECPMTTISFTKTSTKINANMLNMRMSTCQVKRGRNQMENRCCTMSS